MSRFAKLAKPVLVEEGAKVRLRPRAVRWMELGLVTLVGVISGTYIFKDSFMQMNRNSQSEAGAPPPLADYLASVDPNGVDGARVAALNAQRQGGSFFEKPQSKA